MHTAIEFEILFRLISSSSITRDEAFALFEAIVDAEKYRDEHRLNFLSRDITLKPFKTTHDDEYKPYQGNPISWELTAMPCSTTAGLPYTTSTSGNTAQTESTHQDSFSSTATCKADTELKVCNTSGEITDGCSITFEK